MFTFPESAMQCIQKLVELYADSKNYVVISFPVLEIIKYNYKKEVSIKLHYDFKTETFEIQAPTVKFFSKISHYDYNNKTERHWIRNKNYLFAIINNLRTCGLWNIVSNKDFLTVNSYNKKIDSKILLKILNALEG